MMNRLLALALALAACTTGKTETSNGGTHTTTATSDSTGTPTTGMQSTEPDDVCSDHSIVDNCCCFGSAEQEPYVEVYCPAEQLCNNVIGECTGDFINCVVENEADADCILTALQGGKPGVVSWELYWVDADQPMLAVSVYISGSGELFWLGVEYTGDPINFYGVEQYIVADLDIASCAADPVPSTRFECMRSVFVNPFNVCLNPHQSG